jgi:hypothetical protein
MSHKREATDSIGLQMLKNMEMPSIPTNANTRTFLLVQTLNGNSLLKMLHTAYFHSIKHTLLTISNFWGTLQNTQIFQLELQVAKIN